MHDSPPAPATFTPRPRDNCPALDALLGHVWPVGDKGYIELWDYLGNETSIAQAARTSYASVGKSSQDDARLLRRLMADRHTSPFEQAELKIKVRMPMYVARQWVRHRMASLNEVSGRYTEIPDDAETVPPDGWRMQSTTNKQGSEGLLTLDELCQQFSASQVALQRQSFDLYKARIDAGIAKEQARVDLPLSTYTEFVWKIDLHNLLHFLGLRIDKHAQKEFREYAVVLGDIVKVWMPSVWQAFVDFRLEAFTLSGPQMRMLSCQTRPQTWALARSYGWLERREDGTLKPNSERAHFEEFLRRVGNPVIWES